MTTSTIGDHSSSILESEQYIIPPLFGGNSDRTIFAEETSTVNSELGELLLDIYGDQDTSTSSYEIAPSYEAEIAKVRNIDTISSDFDDLKTINKFSEKLIGGMREEPLAVQKKTYDKFWDLF